MAGSDAVFYADLHVHSRFSRACSKNCTIVDLAWWAARKGLTVVGTGDFTHPAWAAELNEYLEPAEPGLLRLRPDLAATVRRSLPPSCTAEVRFMLSAEVSTIYKRGERTRKVHHLIYAPTLGAAEEITSALAKVGNLASDGRPILGLDSRDLLDVTLNGGTGCFLVPAHIWTPWFAVLGSKSGFDSVAECYGDLADHVFAVETGLSSDPPMNWTCSDLDRYRLVSNSDAHSPPMLGREATTFSTSADYFEIAAALRTGTGLAGTVNFFPEGGRYHLDGHRQCGVRFEPAQTRAHGGQCPECGKPLTVGVAHRVAELADRPPGYRPDGAPEPLNLVSLPDVISEVRRSGRASKKVTAEVDRLVAALGPELHILTRADVADIARAGGTAVGEAVARLRRGEVRKEPGYDGEYGVVRLFQPGELAGAGALFDLPDPVPAPSLTPPAERLPAASADRASVSPSVPGQRRPAVPPGLDSPQETSPRRDHQEDTDAALAGVRHKKKRHGDSQDPHRRTVTERTPGPDARQGQARGGAPGGIPGEQVAQDAGPWTPDGPGQRAAHGPGARPPGDRVSGRRPAQDAGSATRDRPGQQAAHGPGMRTPGDQVLGQRPAQDAGTAAPDGLDPDQRAAVGTASPLLVVAGPGTGKTRMLAHRIAAGVARGAAPGTWLALTFTRRAAGELRDRLAALLPAQDGTVTVTTFHGLGLAILREHGGLAGLPAGFTLADDETRLAVAAEVAGSGAAGRKLLAAAAEDPMRRAEFARVLADRGLVDFDGLVELAGSLLAGHPGVAGALRERWPHVVVDEYQDIDASQYALLRLLAGDGRGLTVVGDPDQAIYGFRGADVGFFLRFGQDFPGASAVSLTRNYRSPPVVVRAALQAVAPATLVPGRELRPVRPAGPDPERVGLYEAADAYDEADWIAGAIDRLLGGASLHALDTGRADGHAGGRVSLADIAVLYRTDAQAAPLGQALTRAGLPFQKRSHDLLSRRAGVPEIVAEMRRAALAEAAALGGEVPAAGGVPVVARLGTAVRARAAGRGPASVDVLAAGEVLRPLARRCGRDLGQFFTEIGLGAEADALDPRADAVTLLTLHAAKGLEFGVVFVAGCERGLLPLRLPGTGPDPGEERRLLFVGMTRARAHLFLTCARQRQRHGAKQQGGPSAFLSAIDAALLDREAAARLGRPPGRQLRLM